MANIDFITSRFKLSMERRFRLLRLSRAERLKWRMVKLSGFHYKYIKDFFYQHRSLIILTFALLVIQALLETFLIIFSRRQIFEETDKVMGYFWYFLFFIFVFFLVNAFFAIKYEKTLTIALTNDVRRRIFKRFLGRSFNLSSKTISEIFTKISYHLPLMSVGLSHCFFGLVRWATYLLVIMFIAYFSGFNILLVFLLIVLISVIIVFLAYIFARRYISQEVTFYSQILSDIGFNVENFDFVKRFGFEKWSLKRFDNLVAIDSFFRVRRDILMKIGVKIIFLLLIVISIVSHFFPTIFHSFIGSSNAADRFIFIFFIIYLSRLLYETLRVGLYAYPAQLGLFLSLPKSSNFEVIRQETSDKHQLAFSGRQVRLFKQGPLYRRFNMEFEPYGRYLVYGSERLGKTSLARLIAGFRAFNPLSVKVLSSQRRLTYQAWQHVSGSLYFFDPTIKTNVSLMEYVLRKQAYDISTEMIESVVAIVQSYPIIGKVLVKEGNLNRSCEQILTDPVSAFALHTLHCLVSKPTDVIIDNFWLDLCYNEINECINILDKNLTKSRLILFARHKNNLIQYNNFYEITKKTIEKKS